MEEALDLSFDKLLMMMMMMIPSRAVIKTECRHMICPLSLHGVAMFSYTLLHFKNSRAEFFCIKALRIPNTTTIIYLLSIPKFARSKEWVYGRSLAGIAGSNSAGGMEVYVL